MVDAILKKAVENGEILDKYTDLLGRLSELTEAERQVELQERSWKDDGTETRYVQRDKQKKPEDLNDLIEILEEAIKEKEEEKARRSYTSGQDEELWFSRGGEEE